MIPKVLEAFAKEGEINFKYQKYFISRTISVGLKTKQINYSLSIFSISTPSKSFVWKKEIDTSERYAGKSEEEIYTKLGAVSSFFYTCKEACELLARLVAERYLKSKYPEANYFELSEDPRDYILVAYRSEDDAESLDAVIYGTYCGGNYGGYIVDKWEFWLVDEVKKEDIKEVLKWLEEEE